jgi:hypothetical protein
VCPQTSTAHSTFATAAALPALDSLGRVRIGGGVTQGDDDWYSFAAPKHDPVWIEVNYSVASGNTSTLQLTVDDATDSYVSEDHTARALSSQTLSTIFEPAAAGSMYDVDVSSDTATCTGFDLYVHSLYCTDTYEDNDDFAHAAPIALTAVSNSTGGTSTASFNATIDGLDDDWYSFTAPKADPVSVSVTYARPVADTVTLSLTNYDNTDGYVVEDHTSRSTTSQTLTTVWEASAAGAVYNTLIRSDTEGVCAAYQVQMNGLWCTDAYEDNDSFATAVTLPSGAATISPTITQLDDDYFQIASPAASGSCTVSYTVASGSTQQLQLTLYDTTQGYVSEDHSTRSGLSQTLTATWSGSDTAPTYALVEASDQSCISYTINCH